jgi:hypothetical protein
MSTLRLSALQRRILTELHGLVVAACEADDLDHRPWEESHRCMEMVSMGALRNACADYWQPDPQRSYERAERAKVSALSRSLTTLMHAGYIDGRALAWCRVAYSLDGEQQVEEFIDWAGGGPGEVFAGLSRRHPTPRVKRPLHSTCSRQGGRVWAEPTL